MSHHALENDPFSEQKMSGEGQGTPLKPFSQEVECKVVSKTSVKEAETKIKEAKEKKEEETASAVAAKNEFDNKQATEDKTEVKSEEELKKIEKAKADEAKREAEENKSK